MPIKLPDLKPSSIPKKMPVFEDNEELSYMRTFGRPDAIVLDSYGEYSILSFVEQFPDNEYIKYDIKYKLFLSRYRILNYLAVAPDVYKMEEPLIYAVYRENCRYGFTEIPCIEAPCFLEIMVQIINSSYLEDEMTAIVMDCSKEDVVKDFVPHIKWGIIVNPKDKKATLIDKESAAVQFHKRFRLIEHTFLK
ncbi:MAG: hypothetical protein K2K02_06060 [Ruminococcus sp.]|nr:hypothetical protein [Ruminococcus sp.]